MGIIDVDDLAKSFRIPAVRRDTIREHVFDLFRPHPVAEFHVLRNVRFEVRRGETLGIMGRNGCGKSTLLKIIAGIYAPDRGRVRVAGGLTAILELGVGWNPELDAIDNICLLGSAMGMSLPEIRSSIDEILGFAQVERFANLELKHYSSGMASRLAYSVAFKAVKEILVLDEIFAVGDSGFAARCQERYRMLRAAGHTVLLVSHDARTIQTFCDRVILLEGGRVFAEGLPADVVPQYEELARTIPAEIPGAD